jgi:hypothetical protein
MKQNLQRSKEVELCELPMHQREEKRTKQNVFFFVQILANKITKLRLRQPSPQGWVSVLFFGCTQGCDKPLSLKKSRSPYIYKKTQAHNGDGTLF